MTAFYTVGDGKTFSTIQAAINACSTAISGDFSGQGFQYIDVYAKAAGYAELLDATGFSNADSTNRMVIRAMVSNGGMRGAGIVIDVGSTGGADRIQLDHYTILEGFCITATSFPAATGYYVIDANFVDFTQVSGNLIYGITSSNAIPCYGIGVSGEGNLIRNNQLFDIGPNNAYGPAGYGIVMAGGTVGNPNQCHNNTIYSKSSGTGVMYRGLRLYAYVDATNNGAFNCAFEDIQKHASRVGVDADNMSSDATAGSANGNLSSKVASAQFTSLVAGSEDFSLLATADCRKVGTAQTVLVPEDCRDFTRWQWNTGAFEYEEEPMDMDTLISPALIGAISS